jgi:hypothetical protein
MKKVQFWLIPCVFLICFSCKKYVQQQEQKEALSIMTDGEWYVSGYLQNDSDITASFSGYLFKFNANNTLIATNGTLSAAGQWSDNIAALTITTDFPGASIPLVNLNETWKITDSYADSVAAKSTDTVRHTSNILQLKKQ